MSIHDSLMRRTGAPALLRGHGSVEGALTYRPPGLPAGGTGFKWRGIAGPIRSVVQYKPDGEVRKDTREWIVERALADRDGVLHPQRGAVVEDDAGKWNIDLDQCEWGDVFITLALERSPRTAGNELRYGAV